MPAPTVRGCLSLFLEVGVLLLLAWLLSRCLLTSYSVQRIAFTILLFSRYQEQGCSPSPFSPLVFAFIPVRLCHWDRPDWLLAAVPTTGQPWVLRELRYPIGRFCRTNLGNPMFLVIWRI